MSTGAVIDHLSMIRVRAESDSAELAISLLYYELALVFLVREVIISLFEEVMMHTKTTIKTVIMVMPLATSM